MPINILYSWCIRCYIQYTFVRVVRLSLVMKDVSDEKTKLTGVMESMGKMLEDRDHEIQRLNTQASLNHWQCRLYATMRSQHNTSACAAIKRHQQSVADDRYLSDPHARVHRVFTGSAARFQHWQRDWNRDQCATVAQLCTGHSPLLAGYLHRIGRRDSAHLSILQRRWRDGRAPGPPLFSSWAGQNGHLAGRTVQHGPTMPLGLPGTDWGGDPPPWPGMRERERAYSVSSEM